MAEFSNITWCDHTFNGWIGCTKVGPGCDHCYAEREWDHRFHRVRWGAGEPRSKTGAAYWRKPYAWERQALAFHAEHGHWPRVFANSLSDVFDNEVMGAWRTDLWDVIRETPHLQWLLATKRLPNVLRMVPPDWPLPNVVLIGTMVNQPEIDRDMDRLLSIPAAHHGVSIEPMQGLIDISRWTTDPARYLNYCDAVGGPAPRVSMLDWVIAGGESGPSARPAAVEWFSALAAQCREAGVPFHMKQLGRRPTLEGQPLALKHQAGVDPLEWPDQVPQERAFVAQTHVIGTVPLRPASTSRAA